MRKFWVIAALLAVSAGCAPTPSRADASIPATPPGRALAAWLAAFNGTDSAARAAFTRAYGWKTDGDDFAKWRADTGGYELLDVYANDQTTVFFRVKAKANATEEVGRLKLGSAKPAAVEELGTWRIPAGEKVDVLALDAATRTALVRRVAKVFEDTYLFPEVGKKMSDALLDRDARGGYDSAAYGIDLARQISADLREISNDKHVDLRFSFPRVPAELSNKMKTSEADARKLLAMNCGFEKTERMGSNIGYVKFDQFADPEVCASVVTAAMNLVAGSDALILDLRDNTGGRAAMVDLIASYLFAGRTHLYDTVWRGDAVQESWTSPTVPGRKFVSRPVYVLVSSKTFSAAEALACVLKELKRATLIGETTAGGGHRVNPTPIGDHLIARVPAGRTLGAVTKFDWEGRGVAPDIAVPADEALEVARKLAIEQTE